MELEEPGFYQTWFNDTCGVHPMTDLRVLNPRDLALPEAVICAQILLLAALFTIGRSWAVRCIFGPIADRRGMYPEDYPRFFESGWQITYYTISWIVCAYFVHQVDFFKQTCLCWVEPFPFQPIPLSFHWMYVVAMGWYLHCTYAHLFLDPRKSDFAEMLIHHIVTFALLLFAYSKGYTRIGVLILFCMDLSDVFLHVCKIVRVFDNAKPVPPYVMDVGFPLLPISWVALRLYFYARKVMYSTFFHPFDYGSWRNSDLYIPFNILLVVLFLLQVLWFYYIMKTAILHVFYGAEFDDERDPHATTRKSQ